MSLGICCQWLESHVKRDDSVEYINSIDERSLQLGRFQKGFYSKNFIREVYINNIKETVKIVPTIAANEIKLFRMSSCLFPLWEYNLDILENDEQINYLLGVLGSSFIKFGIRVTTHPDQFVVLSSDNPSTVSKAIKELEHHAWVFDKMGLPVSPHAAINIHGGKSDRMKQLIEVTRNLPKNVLGRLTFENDESAYSLVDLLEINQALGVPIVWDSHHHVFNDGGLSMDDAFELAMYTWKDAGVKPLQHLSNTSPGLENGSFTERRKHSDYIHYIPECQKNALHKDYVDIDVEAKMKNLAVLDLKKSLSKI